MELARKVDDFKKLQVLYTYLLTKINVSKTSIDGSLEKSDRQTQRDKYSCPTPFCGSQCKTKRRNNKATILNSLKSNPIKSCMLSSTRIGSCCAYLTEIM